MKLGISATFILCENARDIPHVLYPVHGVFYLVLAGVGYPSPGPKGVPQSDLTSPLWPGPG